MIEKKRSSEYSFIFPSLVIRTHRNIMNSSGKITFVSSIFRDLVAVSPKFPKPGETIMGGDFFMGFGGKGANQCVMAAKLGAEAAIVGKVGDDEHGNAYTENLQQVK